MNWFILFKNTLIIRAKNKLTIKEVFERKNYKFIGNSNFDCFSIAKGKSSAALYTYGACNFIFGTAHYK
jgi:hypothetical protein